MAVRLENRSIPIKILSTIVYVKCMVNTEGTAKGWRVNRGCTVVLSIGPIAVGTVLKLLVCAAVRWRR